MRYYTLNTLKNLPISDCSRLEGKNTRRQKKTGWYWCIWDQLSYFKISLNCILFKFHLKYCGGLFFSERISTQDEMNLPSLGDKIVIAICFFFYCFKFPAILQNIPKTPTYSLWDMGNAVCNLCSNYCRKLAGGRNAVGGKVLWESVSNISSKSATHWWKTWRVYYIEVRFVILLSIGK